LFVFFVNREGFTFFFKKYGVKEGPNGYFIFFKYPFQYSKKISGRGNNQEKERAARSPQSCLMLSLRELNS